MKLTFVLKRRAKRYDYSSEATIYVRLRDSVRFDVACPTALSINPNFWDNKTGCVKASAPCSGDLKWQTNESIGCLRAFLEKRLASDKNIDKDWLALNVDKYYHPEKYEVIVDEERPTVDELCGLFLKRHKVSVSRQRHFEVLRALLQRYALFKALEKHKKRLKFYVEDLTVDTLNDIWDYIENEHTYPDVYPEIFADIPEKRRPGIRGKNTIIDYFNRLRTFVKWCYDNKYLAHNPFEEFTVEEPVYGTPIYITPEERQTIWECDLSARPRLAIQRDIYIFQCYIGCRREDLYELTQNNVVGDFLEYIQDKTKETNAKTIRVPLHKIAKQIIERYKGQCATLLPFISEQKYNEAIKDVFRLAGIDRMVTVLDSKTRKEVQKPISEVASSHMARRTFVGNLYKQVKDPNLVASMSGHKENSRAFSRYRAIDDDMKKELIDKL